jgi:hypothetical protein
VAVLALLLPAAPQARAQEATSLALVFGQLQRLQGEVAALRLAVAGHDERLAAVQRDVKAAAAETADLKDHAVRLSAQPVLAAAFLASPPAGSDSLGVAKAMVFAPRLQLESLRRHDTLFLKLRRIEPGTVKLVAEFELAGSETTVDLPIDHSGALYALEWSTGEGFTFTLSLRDGASEQSAASVQARPLQNEGRFLFVGARLD